MRMAIKKYRWRARRGGTKQEEEKERQKKKCGRRKARRTDSLLRMHSGIEGHARG